jgi:cytochrome bd-type quinol oxidase subunit 1
MDGEKKMNHNGRLRTKIPDVAGSVSELTHDVIELSELQAKLLVLDIKRSSRRTRSCLILAVVGICFLLGTIPVALAALAQLLVEQLDWTQSAAFGVAALVGLGLAAIAAGIAWGILKSGLISLERSREEFARNFDWLKSTLKNRGQSAADTPHSY